MANPPPQAPQLNWSYFKPEFSGKPEEEVVAHLLRTNDWMETHDFPDDAKVRRFCLTLTGEVRLWYESLRSIEIDWEALQDCFRQQYSKSLIDSGVAISLVRYSMFENIDCH